MSWKSLLLPALFIAILALCPEPSQGQFPGGGGFGGGRGMGGMGGGAPDPEMIWNMMGGAGKESIDINQNAMIKSSMERRGQPLPPGGILTKAQFKADFEKRMAERTAGGGRGGPGGGPPGGAFGASGGPPGVMTMQMGGPGGMPGASGGDDVENRFKQSDRNGDGKISPEEASQFLRPVFQQYDKNSDGFIDNGEYRTYMAERFGAGGRGMSGAPAFGSPGFDPNSQPQWGGPPPQMSSGGSDRSDRSRKQEEEDVRPVVYRYGKMPKEIPSWFEDLDTDKDGMVGLYEWRRKSSKSTGEFIKYDLNGDGYMTAEEWLRFQRLELERSKTDNEGSGFGDAASSGNRGNSSSDRSGSSDRQSKSDRNAKGDRPSKGDRPAKGDQPSPWRKN
jgi:hypothetical protein